MEQACIERSLNFISIMKASRTKSGAKDNNFIHRPFSRRRQPQKVSGQVSYLLLAFCVIPLKYANVAWCSATYLAYDEDEDPVPSFDVNIPKPQIHHFADENDVAGSVLAKTVVFRAPDDSYVEKRLKRLVSFDFDLIYPPYDDVFDHLVLSVENDGLQSEYLSPKSDEIKGEDLSLKSNRDCSLEGRKEPNNNVEVEPENTEELDPQTDVPNSIFNEEELVDVIPEHANEANVEQEVDSELKAETTTLAQNMEEKLVETKATEDDALDKVRNEIDDNYSGHPTDDKEMKPLEVVGSEERHSLDETDNEEEAPLESDDESSQRDVLPTVNDNDGVAAIENKISGATTVEERDTSTDEISDDNKKDASDDDIEVEGDKNDQVIESLTETFESTATMIYSNMQ